MTQTLHGQAEAEKAILANQSPRYKRLEYLERWTEGTQYKGRPNFWDADAPLWEKEPCVVFPVAKMAAESNTDLCLSEGRFPTFKVAEADNVSEFLKNFHKEARFPTVAREAFTAAQGCGTSIAIYGVRKGKPFAELYPAKWCEREDGVDGELEKLIIQYPYLDEYQKANGEWAVRAMLYRREISKTDDVVMMPAKASETPQKISWQPDQAKSTKHNLGFVPVVWYPFMRGTKAVNVKDGVAIHQNLTDEIQAYDIARSQWHRGALLSEPQICEIGVTKGYNPTGLGDTASIPVTEFGGPVTPNNPIRGEIRSGGSKKKSRKKGPGQIWQYENKDTKVELLTYPSDALKAQQDNCTDLKLGIQETMGVVFLDPQNIKFAATTSGKALQAIKQRQVDHCAQYREDFRDGFLIPSIRIQLKLLQKLGSAIVIEMATEALAELGQLDIENGSIEVTYGDFYKPDPEEQKQIVDLLATAVEKGLMDAETAIEKAAPVLGVQDIEGLKERIKKDKIQRQEEELAVLKQWKDDSGSVPSGPKAPPQGGASGRPANGQNNSRQFGA